MRKKTVSGFAAVAAAGAALPDVEVTTTWGVPALKVRGKMFVCMAAHKSAEPDTLVVRMDLAQRDALIEEDPATYYLKEHYVGYPCVLVRLSRVHPDALRDLVLTAYRFVNATPRTAQGRRRSSQRPKTTRAGG
jgi:hypothetical protein